MSSATWRCASVVLAAIIAGLANAGPASAQNEAGYRTVLIPEPAKGPLCADEKSAIISRAATAQADAAENAKLAVRRYLEVQAYVKSGGAAKADVERAARERDQHLDEARRTFLLLDEATRLEEKNCGGTHAGAVAAPSPPAASPPAEAPRAPGAQASSSAQTVVEKSPAAPEARDSAGKPPLAAALTLTAPNFCKPSSTCPLVVEITNDGGKPLASPFLIGFSLGGEGSQIGNILPDAWSCGQANESLTCSGAGTAIEPGGRVQMTVDWQIPEKPRRPSATVCARFVWPARAKDGVYRSEQIAAIQFALKKAGFDPGSYDGRLGTKTVEAIRAFRARAGIEGPTELTGDFMTALFGANGALAGDDNPTNDAACTAVSFGTQPITAATPPAPGAPVAVVSAPPSPAVETVPEAPETPRLAPAPTAVNPSKQATPRRRQQAAIPLEPRRQKTARRAAPTGDEDDDSVVVYTAPPRRAPGNSARPVIVYPDGTYRRWGEPTLYRP